jgi:DNA mismatch repair ATPase MutS
VGPPGSVLLVTGSNMAGKSTLLRAIGTNVMLANAGAPVCASRMSLSRLALATSLRTGDSLAQGVSGYMAGLLRIKQVIDAVDAATSARQAGVSAPAVLYLLDEILGGTNSEERRIAVREIARHLLESNAVGALTTHDLALAEEPTLKRAAVRVHFRETVEPADSTRGGDAHMTFDYVLRPGLATSTNALELLRAIGLARPS